MPHTSPSLLAPADQAQSVALQALAMIVEDDEQLTQFLGSTGADGQTLATQASDPAFLGAVMDFVLQDDARILSLAERTGCAPDSFATLRHALPGDPIDLETP